MKRHNISNMRIRGARIERLLQSFKHDCLEHIEAGGLHKVRYIMAIRHITLALEDMTKAVNNLDRYKPMQFAALPEKTP